MKKPGVPGELTAKQVERGLRNIANLRRLFDYAADRFKRLAGFYRSLSTRHRAIIYFMAGIKKDRHGVKYEELTDEEITRVNTAIEELADIVDAYRDTLSRIKDTRHRN
ncbi:DUF5347 family protein [Serratia marcescens]